MDIKVFTQMLKDKHFTDYQKMKYKYPDDFPDFLQTLEDLYYVTLPLWDFNDNHLVFIDNHAAINQNTVKLLLKPQNQQYGIKAA